MSKPGALDKLTKSQRQNLDTMLRSNGYGDINGACDWLLSEGVQTSRSAVGRYCQRLKRHDKAGEAILNMIGSDAGPVIDEAASLLIELGKLRVREHKILDRLMKLL